MVSREKVLIGSEEWCHWPNAGLHAIRARVDSGAKTSSIHAINISTFQRGGKDWVRFGVPPLQGNKRIVLYHESEILEFRRIRSSSGSTESRCVIREMISIGGYNFEIEITLANRDAMGYRMLLGREAIVDRFVVDPSESFLHGHYDRDELNRLYCLPAPGSTGLNLGILASNPNLYSNRRLIEAGEERGHTMRFLSVKDCYMRLDPLRPQMHCRGGDAVEGLDAIIPRLRPSVTFYGCALVRQFSSLGVPSLNSSDAIAASRDKLFASQLFIRNGLSMPVTGFAHSPLDTKELIDMVGGAPLIVKLLVGTKGQGVILAETNKAAEGVINAMKSLNANLLVQEFIREANGSDLRCFVVGGKVVAAIERRAAKGEYRANLHQGGVARKVRLDSGERKLAIAAARALGLTVCGVDIIRSNRGPLLLEVNSSPGLEGIEKATGKNVAGSIIGELERQLGWTTSAQPSLPSSEMGLESPLSFS